MPPAASSLPEVARPATEKLSRCYPEGRPKPAPPTLPATFCQSFDKHDLARVEAQVRKEVVIGNKTDKLVIDFGCDAAHGPVREIVFEQGSGHGGTLELTRLRTGSDHYAATRISSAHYSGARLEVEHSQLSASALDAALAGARVAMLAKPHVVPVFDPASGIGGGSFSFSSNDFHLGLVITDDGGRSNARSFTGYDSSSEQTEIVPMRLATVPIQKLLSAATWTLAKPDDDDRTFFTERLLVTLSAEPYWWVRERYLANAKALATRAAVPALSAQVLRPIADGASGSDVRSRELAIEALATLTGWDPRRDERGGQRTMTEVLAAVRHECAANE